MTRVPRARFARAAKAWHAPCRRPCSGICGARVAVRCSPGSAPPSPLRSSIPCARAHGSRHARGASTRSTARRRAPHWRRRPAPPGSERREAARRPRLDDASQFRGSQETKTRGRPETLGCFQDGFGGPEAPSFTGLSAAVLNTALQAFPAPTSTPYLPLVSASWLVRRESPAQQRQPSRVLPSSARPSAGASGLGKDPGLPRNSTKNPPRTGIAPVAWREDARARGPSTGPEAPHTVARARSRGRSATPSDAAPAAPPPAGRPGAGRALCGDRRHEGARAPRPADARFPSHGTWPGPSAPARSSARLTPPAVCHSASRYDKRRREAATRRGVACPRGAKAERDITAPGTILRNIGQRPRRARGTRDATRRGFEARDGEGKLGPPPARASMSVRLLHAAPRSRRGRRSGAFPRRALRRASRP